MSNEINCEMTTNIKLYQNVSYLGEQILFKESFLSVHTLCTRSKYTMYFLLRAGQKSLRAIALE